MRAKIPVFGFASSILGLALLLASGPGARFGVWGFKTGILLFLASGAVGLLAIIISALFLAVTRFKETCGRLLQAVAGVALGVVSLVVVAHWKAVADAVPRINDITTDTEHPPEFVAILPLRAPGENSARYPGPAVAAQQKSAYPYVRPKVIGVPPTAAFQGALEAGEKMGWEIVAADSNTGRMEATATTFWFGFKDDVVVRITPEGGGSRVDVRSASRVGLSDLGTNAVRIRSFLQLLNG